MTDTKTAIKVVQGPRENIEDAACVINIIFQQDSRIEAKLLAVADGVGGNRYGEIASIKAIEFLQIYLLAIIQNIDLKDQKTIRKHIIKVLKKVNSQVLEMAQKDKQLSNMSTTIVAALIIENTVHIAWAGDSRCYIYNPIKKLQQISTDHSVTQELVCQGKLDPALAHCHPFAHTITQYVGKEEDFCPEVISTEINDDDILLLCSDGLSDVVTATNDLHNILSMANNNQLSCSQVAHILTQKALENHTTDNATALIYQHSQPNNKTADEMYRQALTNFFKPLSKE
ncbi:MAG: serine/threonine-protein phosphatase [Phycisphaerae bacterium]|nr:serine/threonine-protein phosphatase [Phycisphaerae bacterium]